MTDARAKSKPKARRGPPPGVTETRVRSLDGKLTTIRKVDANSPTFGEDMLYVFRKNVEAARRENKRVTGVTDVAPAKS